MSNEIKELIKEMKEYRDGMVARNLPFQWISDIITKWEVKQVMGGASPTKDFLSIPTDLKICKIPFKACKTYVSLKAMNDAANVPPTIKF